METARHRKGSQKHGDDLEHVFAGPRVAPEPARQQLAGGRSLAIRSSPPEARTEVATMYIIAHRSAKRMQSAVLFSPTAVASASAASVPAGVTSHWVSAAPGFGTGDKQPVSFRFRPSISSSPGLRCPPGLRGGGNQGVAQG